MDENDINDHAPSLQLARASVPLVTLDSSSNTQSHVNPLNLPNQTAFMNQVDTNSNDSKIFQNTRHVFLDTNLPKLSLPNFSGSFDTWLGFRDTFNSMVHNNAQVPDIYKFHYLQSCVKNEAAEVIASLETSSANYSVAWKLLSDRYDNRKFIVEIHVKALFEVPSISREFSVRSLLDNVQKHLRALRALEYPVDQWDILINHLIKEKLNNYTREKWDGFTGNSRVPTFESMVSFLENRAQIEFSRSAQNTPNSSRKLHVKNKSASGQGSDLNSQGHSGRALFVREITLYLHVINSRD